MSECVEGYFSFAALCEVHGSPMCSDGRCETARLEAAEAEVERLTAALAERDQKIADALADAEMALQTCTIVGIGHSESLKRVEAILRGGETGE